MGDLSAEPSMEDILASIKRVIKEGEPQGSPRRMTPRPAPAPETTTAMRDEDEVLELSQAIPAPSTTSEPEGAPSPASPSPGSPSPASRLATAHAAASSSAATAVPGTPGVSVATAEATRGALGALSRLVVRPEPGSDGTLEGLVRDLLRPVVSEWLDANLPRLVEEMVAQEIAKITGSAR